MSPRSDARWKEVQCHYVHLSHSLVCWCLPCLLTVHIFDITVPSDVLTPIPGAPPVSRPFCQPINANSSGLGGTQQIPYQPSYGKSVGVALDWAFIGAPNRDQSLYQSGSVTFSAIDIVNITAYKLHKSATPAFTLYDLTTPNLGLLLDVSDDGAFLASFYTSSQIAVFHPVLGRAQWTFGLATDHMLNLPTGFVVDSLSINGGVLAVTGVFFDPTAAMCVISVLVYQYHSAGSGSWVPVGAQPNIITRSSIFPGFTPSTNAAAESRVPCTFRPQNALPVDVSADGQMIVIGSIVQQVGALFPCILS